MKDDVGIRWQDVRPVIARTRNGSYEAAHTQYEAGCTYISYGALLLELKELNRVRGAEPGRVVEPRRTQAP